MKIRQDNLPPNSHDKLPTRPSPEASLTRGTIGRYPLGPKVRCISFPLSHRLDAGTPLPIKEDHQEGEVDVEDIDAVGEPELGCQLRTVLPLSGEFQEAAIGH